MVRQPTRKWTIHVIQHAHTDVGYTDRQEKIEMNHVGFLMQAIEISEAIRAGKKEWEGFRWTCECFWGVERFLQHSDKEWRDRFVQAIHAGHIELTANYLHIVEIMNQSLFKKFIERSIEYACQIGTEVKCALTADLNGYGWGYAQALADLGVENLSMCVHTHHGMFPLWRKQIPFWWEMPNGKRLLVWNGDHYNVGNELGLAPDAAHSYPWEIAETRIARFLSNLEDEEYPFDFVPVHVSGLLTDNAPPNARIAEFIQQWNQKHGERVEIRMSSLNEFFQELRKHGDQIEVYRGDWPDWWNDGAFSTPMHTQMFRQAQRTLELVQKLDPENRLANQDYVKKAEQAIMMFSEHTWGHSASVREPWNGLIHALAIRKEAFAAEAHEYAYRALDEVLKAKGEAPLSIGRPMKYAVANPSSNAVEDIAQLYVDYWEVKQLTKGLQVRNVETGEIVEHQMNGVSRGTLVCVPVQLQPHEEVTFKIEPINQITDDKTILNRQRGGRDKVVDLPPIPGVAIADDFTVTENTLETPYVKLTWKSGEGIVSMIDKHQNRELISGNREHAAFTPVYEVTKASGQHEMSSIRNKMGRNRKGISVQRSVGVLKGVKQVTKGALFVTVELLYEVAGTGHYSLFITGYKNNPRMDVSVRIHKDSIWDPENLYISLPFTTSEKQETIWLEKPGVLIRPGVDQLPGSLTDFYALNEGLAITSDSYGLAIAVPDSPLIQLGSLEHQDRRLKGHPDALPATGSRMYVWVMTNYWETNFKATLGGFYEFKFSLLWGPEWRSPERAAQLCHDVNIGVVTYRLNK